MADKSNDSPDAANREGSAAKRPDVSDTSRQEAGHTEAGQEATRGTPPGSHDREHQSNYGGGGANGGASGSAKK